MCVVLCPPLIYIQVMRLCAYTCACTCVPVHVEAQGLHQRAFLYHYLSFFILRQGLSSRIQLGQLSNGFKELLVFSPIFTVGIIYASISDLPVGIGDPISSPHDSVAGTILSESSSQFCFVSSTFQKVKM